MYQASEKIIIGSVKQIIDYVRKLPDEAEWKWCYFGINIERKQKIETLLSTTKRYYYAKELYKLSHDLKGPFLDWIAKINLQYKNDLCWWAARLASKSPFQTDFFLLFCYFNLIQDWVLNKSLSIPLLLIIIEDPYLHRLLETEVHKTGINSVFVKRSRFRMIISVFFYRIKSGLAVALFLWRKTISFLIDSYLKIKFLKRLKSIKDYPAQVMVFTFFNERSFKKGAFKDIYKFALIGDIYEKADHKVIIGSQLEASGFLGNTILKTKDNYFLPNFYLKINDWLKVFFMHPIMPSDKRVQILQSTDYSVLFFREYLQESASTSFWTRLCLYYAYKNYFDENKQLKLVIYPFENQPMEKMILLAIQKANCNIVSVGYQHSTISPMEINHFLGLEEYKFTPCPDYIVTNSTHYTKVLNLAGFKQTKIINGGSIRYAKKTEKDDFAIRESRSEKNILFLLQPPTCRSLELIYYLRNVVSKNYSFKLYVKPHPEFFNHKLRKAIRGIDKTVIISLDLLDEILRKIDVVVYSSTTAALEALNKRIPVYKVDTELIDLDILDDLGLKPYRMTERQEIDLDLINFSENISSSDGDVISEPIKEEVWLSILKNHNEPEINIGQACLAE